MRFAGTCNRYSNSAMPQLTSAAMYHGRSERLRRCAYHAKVMNTFEAVSNRMVRTTLTPQDRWREGRRLRDERRVASGPLPDGRDGGAGRAVPAGFCAALRLSTFALARARSSAFRARIAAMRCAIGISSLT